MPISSFNFMRAIHGAESSTQHGFCISASCCKTVVVVVVVIIIIIIIIIILKLQSWKAPYGS